MNIERLAKMAQTIIYHSSDYYKGEIDDEFEDIMCYRFTTDNHCVSGEVREKCVLFHAFDFNTEEHSYCEIPNNSNDVSNIDKACNFISEKLETK